VKELLKFCADDFGSGHMTWLKRWSQASALAFLGVYHSIEREDADRACIRCCSCSMAISHTIAVLFCCNL
jgi:hypothetical protein